MTQFTLSQNTQNLINIAIADGPGTNNANYLNAYNAIYADIVANGKVNAGVQYWFSQAGGINTQTFSSAPSAAAIWISAYTKAAAASEGATITNAELQTASNDIALSVFQTLKNNQFSFNDQGDFSMQSIVNDDAGSALKVLQSYATTGVSLDYAIWGGTLFARTSLQDPTYFSDEGVQLQPDTRDSRAIISGLLAASSAILSAGYSVAATGAANVINLDADAVAQLLSEGEATVLGVTASLVAAATPFAAIAKGVDSLFNAVTGTLVTLTLSNKNTAGALDVYEQSNGSILTFNQGTAGSGTIQLQDGAVINTGGTEDWTLSDISSGTGSDMQTLLTYLGQMGDSLTAAQLDTDNYNYLNPAAAAYTVTPYAPQLVQNPNGTYSALIEYGLLNNPIAIPGAVITGQSTGTVASYGTLPAYNQLYIEGDISQDSISGMQAVDVVGNIGMTQAQFAALGPILTGSGVFDATTGGVYNFNNAPNATFLVFATDWSGTTLIGNSGGQTLVASEFGKDTLEAGGIAPSGQNATELVAGEGVDTLIGYSGGGTVFVTGYDSPSTAVGSGGPGLTMPVGLDGLAAGSMIEGFGANNILEAGGDISGATITGVQTLYAAGSITLSTAELNEFSTISGGGTIFNASTGVAYASSEQSNSNGSITETLTNSSTGAVAAIYVNGAGGETVTPPSAALVGIAGNGKTGTTDTVDLSNGTLNVASNAAASTYGSNNGIYAGTNDTLNIYGTSNRATIGSGSAATIGTGGGNTINAAAGDTINISGNGAGGTSDYVTSSASTVTVAANANATVIGSANTINAGSSDAITVQGGNDNVINLGASTTLTINGGAGDTVYEGSGETTVISAASSGNTLIAAATGNNAFINSGGANTYEFGATFGQDTIMNMIGGTGGTAQGTVAFLSGISDENLWFKQSGTNLVVDVLGTNEQVTLSGWYSGNAGSQVASFTAGGLTLNSQIAQLVSAMASYAAANPGFNPATASAMPTNTALQNEITAAWHH